MEEGQSNIRENLISLLYRLEEISRRDFDALSQAQLNWKSGPENWSILDCYQHILMIFRTFNPNINDVLERGERLSGLKNSYKSGLLGRYLIKRVKLRDDNKFKPISTCPSKLRPELTALSSNVVFNDFSEALNQHINLIHNSEKFDLEQLKVQLPIFPYLKIRLGDAFQYVTFHVERHVVQAQKIYMEEAFPRTLNVL